MGPGARTGASPSLLSLRACAGPIDIIMVLNFSNLKDNRAARARRGVLETSGSLPRHRPVPAGPPAPFAHPLILNLGLVATKPIPLPILGESGHTN